MRNLFRVVSKNNFILRGLCHRLFLLYEVVKINLSKFILTAPVRLMSFILAEETDTKSYYSFLGFCFFFSLKYKFKLLNAVFCW